MRDSNPSSRKTFWYNRVWALQLFKQSSAPPSNLLLNGPKQISRAFLAPQSAEQFKAGWALPRLQRQVLPSLHARTRTATRPPSRPPSLLRLTHAELVPGNWTSTSGNVCLSSNHFRTSSPLWMAAEPWKLLHRHKEGGENKQPGRGKISTIFFSSSPSLSWLGCCNRSLFFHFLFYFLKKIRWVLRYSLTGLSKPGEIVRCDVPLMDFLPKSSYYQPYP